MARLMFQERGGEPRLLAEGPRGKVGNYSLKLLMSNAAKVDSRTNEIRGSAAEWFVVNRATGKVDALVWVEFSAQAVAEAPVPDWCRAPEGAPA